MFQRFSIPALRLVAAWLATSGTALAADRYGDGFYTRGVEAAMYMDQGDAVLDPFYVPAKKWAFLPRTTPTLTQDNLFLDPDEPREGNSRPGWRRACWPSGPAGGQSCVRRLRVEHSGPPERTGTGRPPEPPAAAGRGLWTGKSQANLQGGFLAHGGVDAELGARVAKLDLFADLSVEHRVSGKSSLGRWRGRKA